MSRKEKIKFIIQFIIVGSLAFAVGYFATYAYFSGMEWLIK